MLKTKHKISALCMLMIKNKTKLKKTIHKEEIRNKSAYCIVEFG